MTKECFYDSFSVETFCSQIERELCQRCQTKSHRKLSFAFLALLGEATLVVACRLRVKVCIIWSIFKMLTAVFHSQNIILLIFLTDIIMSGLWVHDRVVMAEVHV